MKPGILLLTFTLFIGLPSRAEHPESRTDDLQRASAEAASSKGGPEHNRLTLVESPRRAGTHAFIAAGLKAIIEKSTTAWRLKLR